MNELHETALQYARYGWHIIPLVPNQKIPLTSAGVKDATSDLAQVSAWWQRWPSANIGVSAFASGFHIIDIDTKSGDGLSEWKQLTSQHETPETACVRTPSGGWHLYYLNRLEPLLNRKLSPNIDTRGLNGYVVAPPSIVDGKSYRWHFDVDTVGIQLLPQWIREKLETKRETVAENYPQAFALSLPTSPEATNKANAYCLLAIERICSDIKNAPNGSRHVTYRDSAVRLVSLALAKWHTVDFEPASVFMSAVRQNPVPVTQKELAKYEERFIDSAKSKAIEPAHEPKWRQKDASFIPIGAEVTLKNGTRGTVRWFDNQSIRVGRETVARSLCLPLVCEVNGWLVLTILV